MLHQQGPLEVAVPGQQLRQEASVGVAAQHDVLLLGSQEDVKGLCREKGDGAPTGLMSPHSRRPEAEPQTAKGRFDETRAFAELTLPVPLLKSTIFTHTGHGS